MVVEDEWIVAQTIQDCLHSAGFRVGKVVASGRDAIAAVETVKPDVIVMDINLGGDMDGIATAERIGARYPTPIVYLTAHSDPDTMSRAAATDVSGYVLKPFHVRQLVAAVSVAAAKPITGGVRGRQIEDGLRSIATILDELGTPSRLVPSWRARVQALALTKREQQVVELLGEGGRVSTMARVLNVSQNTLRNHLKAIFRKVGVHSQDELVEWLRGAGQQ